LEGGPGGARNFRKSPIIFSHRHWGRIKPGGVTMKLKSLSLSAFLFACTTAFAFHCPTDMKKIDEALVKSPKLSEKEMKEVKRFRARGEELHKAGKHKESVETLAKAMKILGISPQEGKGK
jgi:hypothetical protein